MRTRASGRTFLTAMMVAVLAVLLVSPVSAANPSGSLSKAPKAPERIKVPSGVIAKLGASLSSAKGNVSVFVELAHPGAADVYSAKLSSGKKAAKAAANAAKATTNRSATAVVASLKSKDHQARELFRTANAVSGVAVIGDAAQIRALAARSDVKSIRLLTPKKIDNAHSGELINALATWQDLGVFGDGVRVGIIDTGIDYTHANFGGPGTPAAYNGVNRTGSTPLFPSAKVVGGTDLAGEDYNASSTNPAQFTPHPDGNPLDCDNHGSHVAGTTAGFGENPDGSTFTGDYSTLTQSSIEAMKIGPGMAPKALLYAIKVFGCPGGGAGSTNLVAAGIDWALDPNQDGDFSDHLSVVNISIGSDYSAPDDPENLFVANALQHGLLSVISAGNASDLYDVGGSPGNSPEALTVASTRDDYDLLDAAEAVAPAGVAGNQPGQYSVAFNYNGFTRTAPVVNLTQSTNLDGCSPFNAADAARVAGKFAWLEWDDNDATRRCGSAGRSANAVAAGAVGAIFTSGLDHFAAGITGSAVVPVFQLNRSGTVALRPAMVAGTLQVRLAGDLRQAFNFIDPTITDTPSGFTSRGTRSPGVKPDIAAPGDTIVSTARGTGTGSLSISGTSMAAPHVTGVAALLRGARPAWTPAEVKAALMDTATHDVFSKDGPTGPLDAPNRVGAGRIDARAALGNQVIAGVVDGHATVSAGFGPIAVSDANMTLSKTITLTNKSGTAASYDVSYVPITQMPGVSYTLSASHVTVAAHGSATVNVTLNIDRNALRKVADPTVAKLQNLGPFLLPRQFIGDASGNVSFAPTAGSDWALRVPVYSAPKPTSAITVPAKLDLPTANGSVFLPLSGRGLSQGSGDARYLGLFSALELGATSPQLKDCTVTLVSNCAINGTAKGGDLRYVGAGSTAPQNKKDGGAPGDAMIYFGVATWSDWYNIGHSMIPFVDIDVDRDGEADYETFVWRQTATDLLWARTDDLHTGANVDLEPINTQFGNVDTNTFDTNVIVMPVFLDALGIDGGAASARLTYQVGVAGFYTAPADSLIDFTGVVSYDPLAPGLWVEGADAFPIYVASPGTGLVVHQNQVALAKDKSDRSILSLFLHNGSTSSRAVVTKVAVGKAPLKP